MRLPLATDITSRDGTLSKDSLMKNAFAEKKGGEVEVFRRPGLSAAYDLGANQGQGMVAWKNTFFAVVGDTLVQGPTTAPSADGSTWTNEASFSDGGFDDSSNNGFIDSSSYNSGTNTVLGLKGLTDYYLIGPTSTTTGSATGLAGQPSVGCSVAYFAGYYWKIAGAYGGGFSAYVARSTDGIAWTGLGENSFPAREDATLCVHGLYLYLVGGRGGAFFSSTALADVWRSLDGTNWSQITMDGAYAARIKPVVVSDGSDIYIIGGHTAAAASVSDVWVSTNGTTFTQATASSGISTTNRFCRGGVVEGRILVTANNGVWTSGAGVTWTLGTASPPFNASQTFCIKLQGGNLWMLEEQTSNFVWWKCTNNAPGGDSLPLTGAADLPISFTSTSGAASTEYLVLKTTALAWVLTFGSPGTLTQIVDADYPTSTVPGVAYLNGYFFVMNAAGEIYSSNLENPISWGALDFISAEIEPDNGVAIAKHQNYVVAFKDTTTELLYDAGNPSGSPLARLTNAAIQVGCANGYSIASLDGGLFFLSKYRSNQKSVHYFPEKEIQPVEIANEAIKRILTAADTDTVHCFACRISGHSFYVVTLVTEGLTLVYDLLSQSWAQWTFLTAQASKSVTALSQSSGVARATCTAHGYSDGDPVTIAGATPSGYSLSTNITYVDANTFTYPVSSALATSATGTITASGWSEGYFPFGFYSNANGKDYIQHETDGKIYEISGAVYTDAGAPINTLVRTLPIDQGSTSLKKMAVVEVICDRVAGSMLVRYSDDDYQTYSKFRPIDVSVTRKQIRRLGNYRSRILEFRTTSSTAMRVQAVDIT